MADDRRSGVGLDWQKLEYLKNSDEHLHRAAPKVQAQRRSLGIEGLVGGLQAMVINTESHLHSAAVEEMLRYTGHSLAEAFQDEKLTTSVLRFSHSPDFKSADVLIRSRLAADSPFRAINIAPTSRALPDTRLETLIFETRDIEKYVSIQKARGIEFLTKDIVHADNYSFIQTEPSRFTGNSLGFIEWTGSKGIYSSSNDPVLDWNLEKPDSDHLKNIKWIDHAATRVKAQHRDDAILEFMNLTGYNFEFAIYVNTLNSITSVARLSHRDFAMVFTSGISPYISDEVSGPTEKFIRNYGSRVHHIAFQTEKIDDTYQSLADDGMKFLIELVGSPEEGLKQTFTEPSRNTLLVSEYIHRFGDFDGFFTKSNVTLLTDATSRQ